MSTSLQLLLVAKAHTPPCEFYRAGLPGMIPPKKSGRHQGELCPFHKDRHAGSFHVNLQTGGFRCLICDDKGGDTIAFIQLRVALSFQEAVQHLADEKGV